MGRLLELSLVAAVTLAAAEGRADTQTWTISGSTQDASQNVSTGAVSLTGTALDIGVGYVGLRFSVNAAMPVGANIESAYIQFTANGASSTVGGWKLISGQKAASTATFTTTTNDITSRADTDTTARVAWKPPLCQCT